MVLFNSEFEYPCVSGSRGRSHLAICFRNDTLSCLCNKNTSTNMGSLVLELYASNPQGADQHANSHKLVTPLFLTAKGIITSSCIQKVPTLRERLCADKVFTKDQ